MNKREKYRLAKRLNALIEFCDDIESAFDHGASEREHLFILPAILELRGELLDLFHDLQLSLPPPPPFDEEDE